jgi:hypothetical protein
MKYFCAMPWHAYRLLQETMALKQFQAVNYADYSFSEAFAQNKGKEINYLSSRIMDYPMFAVILQRESPDPPSTF